MSVKKDPRVKKWECTGDGMAKATTIYANATGLPIVIIGKFTEGWTVYAEYPDEFRERLTYCGNMKAALNFCEANYTAAHKRSFPVSRGVEEAENRGA